MRGLLIVNPRATSTTGHSADMVVSALDGLVDVEVERTRYRGHARELAAQADCDLVIVLGGDGAINEVVNGLMEKNVRGAEERPLLAAIPGGGGNVFTQALGLPVDTGEALDAIRKGIAAGSYRTVGLGLAGDRYFTFASGLGLDAEMVSDVDRLRARGRRESAGLFLWAFVRRCATGRHGSTPTLTLERDGESPAGELFMGIVTNSSPWTYAWGRALRPGPARDFSSGLDVLALRQLRVPTVVGAVGQMLLGRLPRGRNVLNQHGFETLTFRSIYPIAFHVDGEYLGEVESVKFQFVPDALRVVA